MFSTLLVKRRAASDGVFFQLYVNSRYAKPRFKKFGFEIYDTGNMYLIRSPAGLKLQWYHSTGMMVVDTDVSGNKLRTMGLCGESATPAGSYGYTF